MGRFNSLLPAVGPGGAGAAAEVQVVAEVVFRTLSPYYLVHRNTLCRSGQSQSAGAAQTVPASG